MQDRQREGIAWIDGLDREWGELHNFVFHIRWHRCLYHLDLAHYDQVLALYDREIRAESTEEYLAITNAVALLCRLDPLHLHLAPPRPHLPDPPLPPPHDP